MIHRHHRRLRRRLALLAAGACALLAPASASAADGDRSSFLLGVLPDTQFYSRYGAPSGGEQFQGRFGSEPFSVQTQWLAEHHDELQIPFVAHLGDVVDRHGQVQEWELASAAMATLETAGLPYSILAGNHDVRTGCDGLACSDATRDPATERYDDHFGTARAAAQATFGGRDPSGYHEWHTFTAEGREFLVLALSWWASDAALAWAQGVIDAHPTLPVILTSHQLVSIAGDGVSALETTYGLRVWNELIRGNDQIFLTLNGHHHGHAHQRKLNDLGHSVDQVVLDLQMDYMGGNGYLGLLELDFTNDRIDTTVVSPWVRLKPADTLVADFDHAVRDHPNTHRSMPIDWDARFAGFAPPVAPVAADHGSLIARAEAAVRDGYAEPDPVAVAPPRDRDDHPHVEGTLAHWRFGDGAPGPIAPGETIADTAGGNPITRAALDAGGAAEVGDLRRSDDHAYLSSDPGSICFTNTTKSPLRLSYLSTAADAPLNDETFPGGYTIETFVKIDAAWTSANAWMGALTRDGRRADIAGLAPGDPDEPVLTLAISNLREVQWNAATAAPLAERTNWSGEVMNDTWLHVAAVNDPATQATTLYVNGAPVLRNAGGGVGLATAGRPWRLGSSTWEGETTDGWLGCIGETRIVDRPLARGEWLTARTAAPPPPADPEPPATPDPGQMPAPAPVPVPATPVPVPAGSGPGTTPPASGPTATPPRTAPRPRIRSVRVRGGRLRVRVGVREPARVRVILRRHGRTARLGGRTGRAGTVALRLPRSLRPGRYRATVRVTAGGRTARRTVTVVVPRRS